MQPIPTDVTEWIRAAFCGCNERIAEKLSNNPNLPEESLDLTWIEHLSQFASPVTVSCYLTAVSVARGGADCVGAGARVLARRSLNHMITT
jgi:hypothetical protein